MLLVKFVGNTKNGRVINYEENKTIIQTYIDCFIQRVHENKLYVNTTKDAEFYSQDQGIQASHAEWGTLSWKKKIWKAFGGHTSQTAGQGLPA